jgi:hypothetical protein
VRPAKKGLKTMLDVRFSHIMIETQKENAK